MLRMLAAVAALCLYALPAAGDPIPPPPLSPVVYLTDRECTGFHVGDGLIATAAHCINGLSQKVKLADGSEVTAPLALFAGHHQGFDDLAVLRLTLGARKPIAALALSCGGAPPAGDAIHMTGYPGGYGLATVWGRVAGVPRPWARWRLPVVPINISSYSGFSGSPVMDEAGLVVGVLVGSIPDQHDLSGMTPARRLCQLLGRP